MIERLLIKDSPAFSEVLLNPVRGFNVFSGVSGSGKSVLMESILAVFGLKDSNAQLIEAEIAPFVDVEKFGILPSQSITISIIKKDRVKYFINNQSSSKRLVREILGDCVKYINSQTTRQLDGENILHILDSIVARADLDFIDLREAYRATFARLNEKKSELAQLEIDEKNILDLKEFTTFEIAQIEEIAPKIGEYDELMEFKKNLSKKEKIMERIESVLPAIENFPALVALLEAIDENKPEFEEVLNDITLIISEKKEHLEALSEENIESVLNRLEQLSKLMHKYGSIEAALSELESKKQKLKYYENISFNKRALKEDVENLSREVHELASKISAARASKIPEFASMLEAHCDTLMLNKPRAKLKECDLNANGRDFVEICLQDSKISTLSSGEFNRLKLAMLCVEIEFSAAGGIIILDEIDANLSGRESEGVARILNILSKNYQIFTISHQSHMPALATHHYLVRARSDGGKSEVVLLDEAGKIKEIARMISGKNITNEAILFAKERIKSAK